MSLRLAQRDRECLDGKRGRALRFAMETVVAAARIDRALRLIDIGFAHIDACFYNGRAHLDFVNFLLEHGARLAVPAWTNNGLVALNDLGLRNPAKSRALDEARQLMQAYQRLGCKPVWTCAPYQLPGRPAFGAHIVGSESNAVSFYNSVIGARSNKYGDYLDVCAALTGRVPLSGLHLDENRRAQIVFDVSALPASVLGNDLFYHLLGHLVGRRAGSRVPAILGLPAACGEDELKAIGAAASSSGSVPLFHAVGVTPEAPTLDAACQGMAVERVIAVGVPDLREARRELGDSPGRELDGVALGTPHFSVSEFARLVELLGERNLSADVTVIVTTSRHVLADIEARGWAGRLRDAGIRLVTDTCTYFSPAVRGLEGRVMTNSAKWAYYAPGMLPVEAVIGSLGECVESAVAGEIRLDGGL